MTLSQFFFHKKHNVGKKNDKMHIFKFFYWSTLHFSIPEFYYLVEAPPSYVTSLQQSFPGDILGQCSLGHRHLQCSKLF